MVVTVEEIIDYAEDAIVEAAAKLKGMKDAGILTQEEFMAQIRELSEPAVEVPPVTVPRIMRIPYDTLYKYLDEFVAKVVRKEWGEWADYTDETDPMSLWGVRYMADVYCKSMIGDVFPTSLEPPESEVELTKRYREVVFPRFDKQCKKYKGLMRNNKDNDKILGGVELTNLMKLHEKSDEIEKLGGSEFAPPALIRKELRLKAANKSLGNLKFTVRRYYLKNSLFLAYLELMDIDITSVTVKTFQLYQSYLSKNYERNTGEPYAPTGWNDLAIRVSPFWDDLALREDIDILLYLIRKVPKRKVKAIGRPRPVDAYKLVLGDNLELRRRQDEVLGVYKCIRTTKHPLAKKHKDLLEICFRLMRETGLRHEHVVWLQWGRLPKPETKPVMKIEGIGKVVPSNVYPIDYINFEEVAAEPLKEVPREMALISEVLTNQILAYRKKHPEETEDDYYVFSGKVLFRDRWLGGYRTSMLESLKRMKNPVTGKFELRKLKGSAFDICLHWLDSTCQTKIKPSSFRDSFMTLMLEALYTSPTEFKDITGDVIGTAMKHYRAPAKFIKIPKEYKNRLSYGEIVSIVFNNEG